MTTRFNGRSQRPRPDLQVPPRLTCRGVTLIHHRAGDAPGTELFMNEQTGVVGVLYHATLEFLAGDHLLFRPINPNLRPDANAPWVHVASAEIKDIFSTRDGFLVGPVIEEGPMMFGLGAWGRPVTYQEWDVRGLVQ